MAPNDKDNSKGFGAMDRPLISAKNTNMMKSWSMPKGTFAGVKKNGAAADNIS